MKTHSWKLICLSLFTGLTSFSTRAVELSREQKIAERFAPIVVNEERYLKKKLFGVLHVPDSGDFSPQNQLDRIDTVIYDFAETPTHIFLSYQIMKSWSANPMPGLYLAARHPVDSEDVYVALKKGSGDQLSPVLFAVNRHGQRLVYPVKEEMDAGEYSSLIEQALKGEQDPAPFVWFNQGESGNYYGASPNIQRALPAGSDTRSSWLKGHPIVGSSYMTHSLTRSALSEKINQDSTLTLYISTFSGDVHEDMQKRLGAPPKKLKTYSIVRLSQVLPDMVKFVADKGRIDDMKRCKISKEDPQTWIVRWQEGANTELDVQAFPSHYDPEWYFTRFRPNMLPWFEANFKKLNLQKADTAYSGHGGIVQTSGLCARLKVAESFCRALPKTCRLHGIQGELQEYSSYPLMKEAYPALADHMRSPASIQTPKKLESPAQKP